MYTVQIQYSEFLQYIYYTFCLEYRWTEDSHARKISVRGEKWTEKSCQFLTFKIPTMPVVLIQFTQFVKRLETYNYKFCINM